MKRMFCALAIVALLATACTKDQLDFIRQQTNVEDNPNRNPDSIGVPAAVMSAYHTRYPDATQAEWKKQSDGNYKVEFFRGAVKWQATFSPAGALLKEEHK